MCPIDNSSETRYFNRFSYETQETLLEPLSQNKCNFEFLSIRKCMCTSTYNKLYVSKSSGAQNSVALVHRLVELYRRLLFFIFSVFILLSFTNWRTCWRASQISNMLSSKVYWTLSNSLIWERALILSLENMTDDRKMCMWSKQ